MFNKRIDNSSTNGIFTSTKTKMMRRIVTSLASLSAVAVFSAGITGCEQYDDFDEMELDAVENVSGVTRAYTDCIQASTTLHRQDTLWSENGQWIAKVEADGEFNVLDATQNYKHTWTASNSKNNTSEVLLNASGVYGRNVNTGAYDVFKLEGPPARRAVNKLCMRNDGMLATYYGSTEVWQSYNTYEHHYGYSGSYSMSGYDVKVSMHVWKNVVGKRTCTPYLNVIGKDTVDPSMYITRKK